ncbi:MULTISPECIES: DUF416 family protein [unclassified Pseudomonas]|uniref:DUF416 family protein n=1 Tax=unclassified Pseudomonas TaxID=196821 RepID=UPI0035BEB83E
MQLPRFSRAYLASKLNKLNREQQLLFGILCCERMIPNYSRFKAETGWGDTDTLGEGIEYAYRCLDKEADITKLDRLNALCEFSAPHADDFDSLYVSLAQDCCFSVCCLLDFIKAPNSQAIAQIGEFSTDSMDLFIQETEGLLEDDPCLEEKINNHELMQQTLAFQEKVLNAVAAEASIGFSSAKKLKGFLLSEGDGRLDRE